MKTYRGLLRVVVGICLLAGWQHVPAQARVDAPPQGSYKNIYDMLKEVPGLDVKTGGGRTGSIVVRGTGSLKQQGQPLFVVNGSIYDGDVFDLNPADVSAISVLKDAASAGAYGARGMFGVIVISTKSGTTSPGVNNASVNTHEESAYAYFIKNKIPLRVFGMDDKVLIEGVIQRQQDNALVFIKKRKDLLIPISSVKRVEMMPKDD